MKKIGYIFTMLSACTLVIAQTVTIDQEVIQDGEGIEYIYILTETAERPKTPALYHFITDNPYTEEDEYERVIDYPKFVEDDFVPPDWSGDPLEPTEATPIYGNATEPGIRELLGTYPTLHSHNCGLSMG